MSGNSSLVEDDEERTDIIELSNERKDRLNSIVTVKRTNLSEPVVQVVPRVIPRKIYSLDELESNVNYDDLCGPWNYPPNPVYSKYADPPVLRCSVWEFITEDDMIYLRKHQRNEEIILAYFESTFSNNDLLKGKGKDVCLKILWEVFKFTRDHLFTEKGISAAIGIAYLTHTFFLSHPWHTANEIYQFFREIVLMHAVLNPPKSAEVFTVSECKLLFEVFHTVYMENLVLLRALCHSNYCLKLRLCKV